ncbi:histidine kinase/DNA gyrase B/HSP90-like ATPase [Sulfuritortus calidifontis]|uniref:histidine kinase n=1 Tax=Sulfuritortus calidifontis TaxID=1914471 RepID=A0A4R3JYY6_9PROT|nr:HAMP domain-containing sensor histidine kinase [Sulfuritortus calidifontis]TCS74010.1 histidine kinase/DNA gyrase B/HSP90-like ATPase [Sulfuritortus calidifontis]
MKNSLNILVGFMEENLNKPEVREHPLGKQMAPMLYEVKRLNGNLIQLLTLYKVDQKFYPFDLAENSLEEFLVEIGQQSATLLSTHNAELAIDVDSALYWYFDRDLVTGVVSHALNNASRYSRGKLHLSAAEADGGLEIRVEDNGSGYPQAMIEAGHAANRGVSFGDGSTGLGLYFSALVAQMHKNRGQAGRIRLENGGRLGGGCFVLWLP